MLPLAEKKEIRKTIAEKPRCRDVAAHTEYVACASFGACVCTRSVICLAGQRLTSVSFRPIRVT